MLSRSARADAVESFPDRPADGSAQPCPLAAAHGHWIAIELVDEAGKPVGGETFVVKAADGTVLREGRLDGAGRARIDGLSDPSDCSVSFPNLDAKAWEPI